MGLDQSRVMQPKHYHELGNDLGQFTNLSERITYIEANMYNQTENKNEIELWEFQNLKIEY